MSGFNVTLLLTAILSISYAGPSGSTSCRVGQREIAAGEVWTTSGPQGCKEYSCGEDGAVTSTLCSHFIPMASCRKIPGDFHAQYPSCCPKLYCPAP